MSVIKSFSLSCLPGNECECIAILLSLHYFHPNTNVYLLCKTEVVTYLESYPFDFNLNIDFDTHLDYYFNNTLETLK